MKKDFVLTEKEDYISVGAAAHLLGTTNKTVLEWIKSKQLKTLHGTQKGHKTYVGMKSLKSLIEKQLATMGRHRNGSCTGGRGKQRICLLTDKPITRSKRIDCLERESNTCPFYFICEKFIP